MVQLSKWMTMDAQSPPRAPARPSGLKSARSHTRRCRRHSPCNPVALSFGGPWFASGTSVQLLNQMILTRGSQVTLPNALKVVSVLRDHSVHTGRGLCGGRAGSDLSRGSQVGREQAASPAHAAMSTRSLWEGGARAVSPRRL